MRLRFCVLLFGGLLLSSPLVAQDEAPVESAAEAPAPASAEESAAENAGAAAARAETDDDDDFVPSEEIPPDEQVVFPVDI